MQRVTRLHDRRRAVVKTATCLALYIGFPTDLEQGKHSFCLFEFNERYSTHNQGSIVNTHILTGLYGTGMGSVFLRCVGMIAAIPHLEHHNFELGPSDWPAFPASLIVLRLLLSAAANHGPWHPVSDDGATPARVAVLGIYSIIYKCGFDPTGPTAIDAYNRHTHIPRTTRCPPQRCNMEIMFLQINNFIKERLNQFKRVLS